ncbi:MAG: hypothetical protein HY875_17270 [Chloroflexi bacterium]|nr:hypothetical protein [Chloroflexota bacterium]
MLRIPDVRPDWIPVPFVVDTGAAVSCIHALDAVAKFGMTPASLDPAAWPSARAMGGIGGQLRYLALPASYAFLHDHGQWEVIDSTIYIGEMRSQTLPALLGCDLLSRFVLTVSAGRTVTLDH